MSTAIKVHKNKTKEVFIKSVLLRNRGDGGWVVG